MRTATPSLCNKQAVFHALTGTSDEDPWLGPGLAALAVESRRAAAGCLEGALDL